MSKHKYEIVKLYPDGIEECDVPAGYEDSVAGVNGSLEAALQFTQQQYGAEACPGPEPVVVTLRELKTGLDLLTITNDDEELVIGMGGIPVSRATRRHQIAVSVIDAGLMPAAVKEIEDDMDRKRARKVAAAKRRASPPNPKRGKRLN